MDEAAIGRRDQEVSKAKTSVNVPQHKNWLYETTKRLLDIVISLIGLLIMSPIMAAVAIAIKSHDGGPVIHKATRLGKNGKKFKMFKFRTMVMNADNLERWFTPKEIEKYKQEYKLDNDPRITKIGSFLRKTSIDELPQLISVLFNDMSLIGPRPIVESERCHYSDQEFDLLCSIKPGITGYWQVNGRSDSTYTSGKRQELELFYVKNRSFVIDFKILLMTFAVVLKGKGAK